MHFFFSIAYRKKQKKLNQVYSFLTWKLQNRLYYKKKKKNWHWVRTIVNINALMRINNIMLIPERDLATTRGTRKPIARQTV